MTFWTVDTRKASAAKMNSRFVWKWILVFSFNVCFVLGMSGACSCYISVHILNRFKLYSRYYRCSI